MPIAHVKLYCAAFIVLSMAIGLHSCKKETSCEGRKENNKLPIAIAGPDQVITLPTDNVLLDESSSSDPDGRISSNLRTKNSGPATLFYFLSKEIGSNVQSSLLRMNCGHLFNNKKAIGH